MGRVELLPLSATELGAANKLPSSLAKMIFQGGYRAIYDRNVSPQDWFNNYIATYIERDVRQIIDFASDWVNGVNKWQSTAGADSIHPTIVYCGAQSFEREGFKVWGWKDIGKVVKA